ncbi:Gfo/Idh/MocA family protein [Oceaniradius stylonematis]|uniref:Gfo/Idh/MocA family protein n=1 Tax=Oceaniradius stylonematis TaxID=2184161 RepID=UPI00273FE009|nr:Gfo/Idh/MocA family oxidoreductase [Oceaniradius stylonematis]
MSDQPSVAVIGCGQWGRNHVRTLAGLGALAAVADRHPERAAALAQEHGAHAAPVEALVADRAVKALVLALPAEENAALACAALEAGKHVLVEKPIALTVADAEKMVAAARDCGRVLMVGHVLRYHNAFRALVGAIEAGRIGAVRHIQSHRLGFGKFYDRFDALWDLAPHDLSLVLSLAEGAPRSVDVRPVSVTGGQTDMAHVHLDFAGGPTAHIFVSRHSAYGERRFAATGETGTLVWDDLADWPDKLHLVPHTVRRGDDGRWQQDKGEAQPVAVEPGMALTDELVHFLDCVRTGATPLSSGMQGLDVVRILSTAP